MSINYFAYYNWPKVNPYLLYKMAQLFKKLITRTYWREIIDKYNNAPNAAINIGILLLHPNIKLIYYDFSHPYKYRNNKIFSDLTISGDYWMELVISFFHRLSKSHNGRLLIKRLYYYLDMGRILEISNTNIYRTDIADSFLVTFDPHNSNKVFLIVPSIPCSDSVICMSSASIYNCMDDIDLMKVILYKSASSKLTNILQKYNDLIIIKSPPYISFIHELIHVVRYFEGLLVLTDKTNIEEPATIYGIDGYNLYIDNVLITENTFRKEYNLLPRICHEAGGSHINNKSYKDILSMFTGNQYWQLTGNIKDYDTYHIIGKATS